MTPDEWLATFEAKIADVKQKAAEFQENLESSGATESSADGSLTVTVAPNGSLTELRIDDSAMRHSGTELAGRIMRLARKAQRAAAVHVAEAFAPLAGEDSEALRMVTGYLPPDEEEPDPADDGQGYAFTEEPTEPTEPTGRPGRPGQVEPPGRRTRPRSDNDDEDFGDNQIFGRRDDR